MSEHSLTYDCIVHPISRLSSVDRRAQIIEAVTPAVLEHGIGITTRQLSEAAGVAEGTLFKAFGDKESLLVAVAAHHLSVDEADESGPLAFETLEDVVNTTLRVLAERMRFTFRLWTALGPLGQRAAADAKSNFDASKHRLAERFVPFRDQLRVPPVVAAEVVRTLSWAAAADWGEQGSVSPVDDILQVLLHGIVRKDAASTAPAAPLSADHTAPATETQKV